MIKSLNIYKAILLLFLTLVLIFDVGSGVKFAFALLIIGCLIVRKKKLMFFRNFVVLVLPILSGFMFGLNSGASFDVMRDIFYLISPMLYLLTGAALYKKVSLKFIIQTIVAFGVLITIKKALINVSYVGFVGLTNPFLARYGSGFRGDPMPAIACGLLLIVIYFGVKVYSPRVTKILLAINLYGFYLMASRVYLILLICFCLIVLVQKFRRRLGAIAMFGIFTSVLIFVFLTNVQSNSYKSDTFVGKLINSVNEISASNYRTDEDINVKYRGYESFMAWNTFQTGTIAEMIFGELGKLVDLKIYMTTLSEKPLRFIPILHNGYLYILIKTGILGFILYGIYFIRLIVFGLPLYLRSENKLLRFMTGIFLSAIIALLLSNFVIPAFFAGEMILLQILIGYIFVVLKDYKKDALPVIDRSSL